MASKLNDSALSEPIFYLFPVWFLFNYSTIFVPIQQSVIDLWNNSICSVYFNIIQVRKFIDWRFVLILAPCWWNDDEISQKFYLSDFRLKAGQNVENNFALFAWHIPTTDLQSFANFGGQLPLKIHDKRFYFEGIILLRPSIRKRNSWPLNMYCMKS